MSKVKLIVRGRSNPSALHIRFYHGKIDVSGRTNLLVDPSQWDNRAGNHRNLKSIELLRKKQLDFEKLKIHVIESYNDAYRNGDVIDREWLENSVGAYYNRPVQEKRGQIEKHLIYYIDFVEWWLENKAKHWKTGKNKYLAKRAIQQYRSFLQLWRRFSNGKNLAIKKVNSNKINEFISWLEDSEGYAENTIKRHIGRLRFFLNRAKEEGIKTATDYQSSVFVSKGEEIEKPYLNEQEIDKIFKLELSKQPKLEASRDYLILSVYTGLRISDFMNNLGVENIKDGYIEVKTKKTGAFVKIPIHPKVKTIFDKRLGNLPPKLKDSDYNLDIKTVCRLAGLDQKIFGSKLDWKKRRHVTGYYPKWQLITSHIGRRSLATLLHGKVPKEIIAAVGGWQKDGNMVEFYNKTTKTDYANQLAEYWAKQE